MKSKNITVEELERTFSSATRGECRRFLHSFPNHAETLLTRYLKWRELHGLNNIESVNSTGISSDSEDWDHAFNRAFAHHTDQTSGSTLSSSQGNRLRRRRERRATCSLYREEGIPQLLFYHSVDASQLRDRINHPILHCLPAMIDLHSHHTIDVFVTTFALYLDSKLDRFNEEQLTLVIDVRPGRGWPNPPALQMVGFVRLVARALHELHPGRLRRCIVFPVPSVALYIWNMVRRFVDPSVAERMVVVVGGADLDSPLPCDKLRPFLDMDCLERLEAARFAAFT